MTQKMKTAGAFLLTIGLSLGADRGATVTPEQVPVPAAGRRALSQRPPPVAAPIRSPLPSPPADTGWVLVDSLCRHVLIPAGERMAVVFDSATGRLADTLLRDWLTPLGHQAVGLAPTWLQDDLADNFRRMSVANQDRLADAIVHCPDKRYYDEVCFQAAHLAPGTLANLPVQLLVDNVQAAYQIDHELGYVDVIDYGDPLQGGDYYSTTRYRALAGGDTVVVELPREEYYWWIVMPKVTDEQPRLIDGFFWREYLFYEHDSGYPQLAEKLRPIRYLWNGERQRWDNRGLPFPDTLPAVAVVSRWVAQTLPRAATPPRPIQPIEIARDHDGNCGEVQDLLCAAARTALIPCGGVLDINEDHVWCEIWWEDEFHPWQVDLGGGPTNIRNPGIAYDRRHGGGKQVSGVWDWRNDGLQRSVVGTYSDVCTLTVEVRDSTGRPVDGAVVKIMSEGWQTTEVYNCFFGVSDRSGRYATTLGDWQNYYLIVSSRLGSHAAGRIIDSAACEPDRHFFYACTLAGRLESLEVRADTGTGRDEYRLDVVYAVDHEALYGYDCWNSSGANEYALVRRAGWLDLVIVGERELERYLAGEPFAAHLQDENRSAASHQFVLPGRGRFFAVLSNEEQANATQFVGVEARLYRRATALAEPPATRLEPEVIAVEPSPFVDLVLIRLGPGVSLGERIRVLDRGGRMVRSLAAERLSDGVGAVWDGCDERGRPVPAGVYYCRAGGGRALAVVRLGRRR